MIFPIEETNCFSSEKHGFNIKDIKYHNNETEAIRQKSQTNSFTGWKYKSHKLYGKTVVHTVQKSYNPSGIVASMVINPKIETTSRICTFTLMIGGRLILQTTKNDMSNVISIQNPIVLPALFYEEIQLKVQLFNWENVEFSYDYIYCDTELRRKLAQEDHVFKLPNCEYKLSGGKLKNISHKTKLITSL